MKRYPFKIYSILSTALVFILPFVSCSINPKPIKPVNVFIDGQDSYNFVYSGKSTCSFPFQLENFVGTETIAIQIKDQKKDGASGEFVRFVGHEQGEMLYIPILDQQTQLNLDIEEIPDANLNLSYITFSINFLVLRSGKITSSIDISDLTIYETKPINFDYFLDHTTPSGDYILDGLNLEEYDEEIKQCNILIIPSKYTDIADEAFYKNSVSTIPDCIKWIEFESNLDPTSGSLLDTIGAYAFKNAPFFGNLHFPSTILHIWNNAFEGCNRLDGSIIFPELLKELGSNVFNQCSKIKNVVFNSGITSLPSYTFNECESLETISPLPDNLLKIGDNAFSKCINLKSNIIIPNLLQEIGNFAFDSCQSLTSVDFNPEKNNKLLSIGESAFRNCRNIKGRLFLPNSVKDIGNEAFENCNNFVGILTLPSQLTNLGEKAFYGCTGFFGSINFGTRLRYIGKYAFANCGNKIYELDFSNVGQPDPQWLSDANVGMTLFIGFNQNGLIWGPVDLSEEQTLRKKWEYYIKGLNRLNLPDWVLSFKE